MEGRVARQAIECLKMIYYGAIARRSSLEQREIAKHGAMGGELVNEIEQINTKSQFVEQS